MEPLEIIPSPQPSRLSAPLHTSESHCLSERKLISPTNSSPVAVHLHTPDTCPLTVAGFILSPEHWTDRLCAINSASPHTWTHLGCESEPVADMSPEQEDSALLHSVSPRNFSAPTIESTIAPFPNTRTMQVSCRPAEEPIVSQVFVDSSSLATSYRPKRLLQGLGSFPGSFMETACDAYTINPSDPRNTKSHLPSSWKGGRRPCRTRTTSENNATYYRGVMMPEALRTATD